MKETEFISAERTTEEIIKQQQQSISSNTEIQKILDAVPESVMILNKERQIVYVNKETLTTLNVESMDSLCGLRPGESLECSHAHEAEAGCGASKFCRFCGAAKATFASQNGKTTVEECRIIQTNTGTALDLRIKASPYTDNGTDYTILAISDISSEKRKEMLERIFFHDILNTAGGLFGYSELLMRAAPDEADEFGVVIHKLSEQIIDEINVQRHLIQAENGQLETDPETVDSLVVLQDVVEAYSKHEAAEERTIEIDPKSQHIKFLIDRVLLSRILGNLIKNALEASQKGEYVKVNCQLIDNELEYQVSNQGLIPEAVQMQIFQRSFSTKGKGRGLGTYSIKLLAEKYLGGKIDFVSEEERGTRFFARFPVSPKMS